MLTSGLAIARCENGRVIPDRLTRRSHGRYLAHADRMLHAYRMGLGRTRHELHQSVRGIFSREHDCPLRRIDALCKLLDDAGTFSGACPSATAQLRQKVFRLAAACHPLIRNPDRLFPHAEDDVKRAIASKLGMEWPAIAGRLFADMPDYQRLESFAGYPGGAALLARYNVAQVQAALYRAVDIIVWASDDFKTILRYAKLARLMHAIRRLEEGKYEIRFDGPASILHGTRRYGLAMARFLPALIACRGWRLHAVLQTRRKGHFVHLDLSHEDRLTSHLPAPAEFDSKVEENFYRRWGENREGWTLHREGEVLHHHQKVFFPDFVFRHDDGRSILMEIIGFWTPEYLAAKMQTLRTFENHRILLAVADSLRRRLPELPPETIYYKSALKPRDVLERLKRPNV